MRTLLLIFLSFTIWSETSEQYVVRSEFMFCNLNEGKNYQDVLAQQLSYEKFLVEKGLQYNRANLLPIWDNDAEFDYIQWGNWPDGEEQYREWGAYLNEYPEWAANNDVPSAAGTCGNYISMINHAVFHIRTPVEEREERNFTDWRYCKLKKTGDLSKLKEVFAKIEQAARDFGSEEYGIHLFTPYRGFQDADLDWDFIMMHHWYNAAERSKGVSLWPEWRDYLEEKGLIKERNKHIDSCSGADTYQMDWVFSTAE
jgi:hypothetical protein